MFISIIFILFFSGVAFISGMYYGVRTADKNYAKIVAEQGLLSLKADIIKIRVNKRISATERKQLRDYDGVIKQIDWELTRELVDYLIKTDLIKKTVERLATEEQFRNQTGLDTLYTYEIRVIDPDVFS